MLTSAQATDDESWSQYKSTSKQRGDSDSAILESECKAAGLKNPIRPKKGGEFDPPDSPSDEWWSSVEAAEMIATMLSFQTPSGGWSKGVDCHRPPRQVGEAYSPDDKKSRETAATIDNGSTTREIQFLAEAAFQTSRKDCKTAVQKGMEFLLASQYPSGGWPQFYPLIGGYHDLVTFNDDAMAKVLSVLKKVTDARQPFTFLDDYARDRAKEALRKGIACLMKSQVTHSGKLTGWCAQYEPRSLEPAKGRAFEPVALASAETCRLMELLMSFETPDEGIVTSVKAAGNWLKEVQLHGVMIEKRIDPKAPKGWDRFVVNDPKAPPLWARFYEIGSMRPVFGSEDGTLHYALDEIDYGRRVGYDWYDSRPRDVMARQWPEWIAKMSAHDKLPANP